MRDRGVLLRLSVAELEAVDRVRGSVPRAVWIRELCRDAVAAHDALEAAGAAVDPRLGPAEELIEQAAEVRRARLARRANEKLREDLGRRRP